MNAELVKMMQELSQWVGQNVMTISTSSSNEEIMVLRVGEVRDIVFNPMYAQPIRVEFNPLEKHQIWGSCTSRTIDDVFTTKEEIIAYAKREMEKLNFDNLVKDKENIELGKLILQVFVDKKGEVSVKTKKVQAFSVRDGFLCTRGYRIDSYPYFTLAEFDDMIEEVYNKCQLALTI
jgi:hypothetical protein